MEAPDFDELEWMAQQEFLCEDLHPDSHSLEESQLLPPSPPLSDSIIPPPEVYELKRASFCDAGKESAHKRARTADVVQQNNSEEDSNWVEHEVETWSLACSSNSTMEICDSFEDPNSKLPTRRLADINGDFMPITDSAGDRVYSKIVGIPKSGRNLPHVSSDQLQCGLLSEPFNILVEQIENDALRRACGFADDGNSTANCTIDSSKEEQLWVDKYAPKSFTELLSDEQTNREVLKWLKQWDKCVFGGKKTSTSVDVFAALKQHTIKTSTYHGRQLADRKYESVNAHTAVEYGSKHSDSKFPVKSCLEQLESSLCRPKEKILLLCGPPGLGKTTLAHVVAKHCGYRIVEINASDDRVASTLQAKILDAIQMKSVMGDMRPNCVIIDEIDGALGGPEGKDAIDALLKIAYADAKESLGKENAADNGQVKKGSHKKNTSINKLSRPVICICNDLYAPALRQLRQMAKVHVFVQPSINRVVTRLKYICNLEGYKVNARALTALTEHTDCDIRSCLNTLQFLKRKQEPINMYDIASQVVGRKDMTNSAFDIWGEVLQKRQSKNRISSRILVPSSNSCSREHKEFLSLHDLLSNHGNFELINDGIYENLLSIRCHDTSFDKTVQCLELLGDSEIMSHHTRLHQLFSLNAYHPTFAIAIRRMIAQPEKPQIEWPKSSQRFNVDYRARKELLRTWMMSMQPSTHQNFTIGCLTRELLSPLLYVLSSQKLRPVAPQLLTRSEKDEMSRLIDIMINYGITYKIQKTSLSNDFMDSHGPIFDPPIHKLILFKEYKPGYQFLSSTLRQVLSHEVEIETIKRQSAARNARATMVAVSDSGEFRMSEVSQERQAANQDNVVLKGVSVPIPVIGPASAAKGTKNPTTVSKKPAVNYFAQFRKVSGRSGTKEDSKDNDALARRDSRPIFFKFNEGFTNAIRRPMLVQDFI